MTIIALDVGGSSIKHGVVHTTDISNLTINTTSINSNGTLREIINTFSHIIRYYLTNHPHINQIAIGFPGPFDYVNGISYITNLNKYDALYGQDIAQLIRSQFKPVDLQIRFRNDAEAAIVGEGVAGSGQNYERVIGITLGTGIGSAFLVDGQPIVEGQGVPEHGWLYPQLFDGKQADDIFSTRGLLARFANHNIELKQVADVDLSQSLTQQILHEFGHDLGVFLKPFVLDFQADAVLFLGGIAHLFDQFEATLALQLAPTAAKRGILEERAALLGAARLFSN